jgi:uridine phosphorylase
VADDDQTRLRDLVIRGTEISTAATVAAGAAHFLTEDPNAVVTLLVDEAPLFAGAIAWVATEYLDRRLSARERLRVDTAITFAARKAYQRVMNGDIVRSDDFFQRNRQEDRAPSEDIAEAIALDVVSLPLGLVWQDPGHDDPC